MKAAIEQMRKNIQKENNVQITEIYLQKTVKQLQLQLQYLQFLYYKVVTTTDFTLHIYCTPVTQI